MIVRWSCIWYWWVFFNCSWYMSLMLVFLINYAERSPIIAWPVQRFLSPIQPPPPPHPHTHTHTLAHIPYTYNLTAVLMVTNLWLSPNQKVLNIFIFTETSWPTRIMSFSTKLQDLLMSLCWSFFLHGTTMLDSGIIWCCFEYFWLALPVTVW